MKYFIVTLAVAIVLGLIGCDSKEKTSQIAYASQPITTPTPFAEGVISTSDNSEFDITFTPDGLTAYFSRRAPGEKQKIFVTRFLDESWSTPTLAEFSTDRDETAFITPDGKYFFFGSERPIPDKPNQGNFDMNIWMMEKTKDGWSNPKPLPKPINEVQIKEEEWPSSNNNFFFTNDNYRYYYTTMIRGTQSVKLYTTTYDGETFSQPEVINGIFDDDKTWIYSAVLSPNGEYLVFNSYDAPGGTGGEDIFISKKTVDGWSKAKPIGSLINTKDEESSPRFSRDGKYFFFSRAENLGNYEYGEWSLYFIETESLHLENLFEQ